MRQTPTAPASRAAVLHAASRGPGRQRGGFAVGLVVGLLIGIALALGVALYVTKVPVPFVNKVPQRTPGQDAAEAEKNRNWDPNSPLYGKNPARPGTTASGAVAPAGPMIPPATATAPATAPAVPATPPTASASAARGARDPAAILADRPAAPAATASRPAAPALAAGGDPFTYFVQAGAYGRSEDAEQQRARLAMLGMEARLTEREQAGRTVYRVRIGPFERKSDADAAKEKLGEAGIESALVRVQR
jgi:cell division protein FtsN